MTNQTKHPTLASLEYLPYLDPEGEINNTFQGQVGVYAIFDQNQQLKFIGYSRDIYLSLKQHLIRQPDQCYWFKVQTIARPSRTILEEIRESWIAENGSIPVGNSSDLETWTQPINVKNLMLDQEKQDYEKAAGDELSQIKVLKKIARRVEAEILSILAQRGLKEQLRFNPKLKETGLLDLK